MGTPVVSKIHNQIGRWVCVILAVFMLAVVFAGVYGQPPGGHAAPAANEECGTADTVSSAEVSWLEPRGLNIVDLVGFVPDQDLAGAIISYSPGYGIVRYQSGVRVGNTVTITTKVYPRYIKDTTTG
ncbi:MAG: hypothetical protein QW734_08230 [Candidatus Bathyarchaeia archaeon]